MANPSDDIPDDIWFEVISYLDTNFVVNVCALVSKRWLGVVRERAQLSITLNYHKGMRVRKSPHMRSFTSVHFKDSGPYIAFVVKGMPNIRTIKISPNTRAPNRKIEKVEASCELAVGLSRLKHLQEINLDGCRLESRFLDNIAAIQSLMTLRMEWGTHNFDLTTITKMTQVKTLSLKACKISDSDIIVLSGMSNLTCLDISYNNLSDESINTVSTLSNLMDLDISRNNLTSKAFKSLRRLNCLTRLIAYGMPIDVTAANCIQDIHSIMDLCLSECYMNMKSFRAICKMHQLTSLDISKNPSCFYIPECMCDLANLKSLNLSSTHVSGGISVLSSLKNLTELNVDGNSFDYNSAFLLTKMTKLRKLTTSYPASHTSLTKQYKKMQNIVELKTTIIF